MCAATVPIIGDTSIVSTTKPSTTSQDKVSDQEGMQTNESAINITASKVPVTVEEPSPAVNLLIHCLGKVTNIE